MRFIVQLVADTGAGAPAAGMVATIERPDDGFSIDDLGLTLAESKAILWDCPGSVDTESAFA